MKKFLLALIACLGLSGCVVEGYDYPPGAYSNGTVEFCDDYGCRYVTGQYYYDSAGVLFYWDSHFGCWMGPHGYWHGGVFYHGFHPGYHGWYHGGWYHAPHYYNGGHYHYNGGHYGGHRR